MSGPGIWDGQPAAAWADAFLAGNGRHGALVHGVPGDETVIVTQHRLVQPNGTAGQPPPLLAGRLAEVRALLLAGESAAALDRLCAGWAEHWPQPFHPAFAVRSALPGLGPVRRYRRAVDFADGLVTAEWSGPDGTGGRRACFVSQARDVVVQQLSVPGAAGLDLVVWHDAALPGAPADLGIRPRVRAAGQEAMLSVVVRYPGPQAGGYAGATRIIAPGGRCTAAGDRVRVTGAAGVLLLTQVCVPGTGAGVQAAGASPAAGTLGTVPADATALLAEHSRLHRAAYGQAVDRLAPGDARPPCWRALAGRLPPYQINPDQALAEWAWPPGGPPLPDNYDHRHVSHLYPVWPLHEINPADTPDLAAAAVRALRLRGAENGSAHGGLHQALAAARLHEPDLAGARLAGLTGQDYFFRSLMSSHYPGRQVYNADAACALPGLLTELLADSIPARPGRLARLVLLPAVPGFLPAGRLRGARTLLQSRLNLTWDLRAGRAAAELTAPVSQPIELTCPAAPGGAAARCTASVPARLLRPGTWRLDVTAGQPVRITLGWPPAPERRARTHASA